MTKKISETLPDEYKPSSVRARESVAPRNREGYGYGTRLGGVVEVTWSPRGKDAIHALLNHEPAKEDHERGMPVIVLMKKDGTDEVLYVWQIARKLWKKEK
jgi:hypothetical protein